MTPMLNQLTISELATRLSRREVSATEATEACLKQVETVDGRIHAFLSFDRPDALAQAEAADRQLRTGGANHQPLLGIPVAIKDVISVKGQPLNCASKILKNFVSPYDATVIEKFKRAASVGVTHVSNWMMFGGIEHEKLMRSIRLMGEEVIPALRDVHPPADLPDEILHDTVTAP